MPLTPQIDLVLTPMIV